VDQENVVAAGEEPSERSEPTETPRLEPSRGFLAELVVIALILLFGTSYLIQLFVIPSGSMEGTLLIGDHLVVDKLSYAPSGPISRYLLPYTEVKRGDIIVFRYPVDLTQTFVKRCIGLPGDHLRLVNKKLVLNGHPVNEPYVYNKSEIIDSYRDNFPGIPNTFLSGSAPDMLENHVVNGEVIVPQGSYFAMGDNRDNSSDSRYWGFVPRANIIGKPLLIYWSYETSTEALSRQAVSLTHVFDIVRHFPSKTRWGRTFQLIHGYPLN
jgi:signal peptidase I